jgi:hypothetical protein
VVNPDYTGTYNFTDRDMSLRPYNYSYTYYKGILVDRRGGFAIYGWAGVVNITLIDTSTPELKSKLGLGEAGTGTQQTPGQPSTPVPFIYWITFFIAIPVVSGVAAYMTAKRRRLRQAQQREEFKSVINLYVEYGDSLNCIVYSYKSAAKMLQHHTAEDLSAVYYFVKRH